MRRTQWTPAGRPSLPALTAIVAVCTVAATLVSCSGRARKPAPTPESLASAAELYDLLKENQAVGNYDAAAMAARELVRDHEGYPLLDEVLYRSGEIAFAQGRYADAAVALERMLEDFPLSQYRQQARMLAARCYERTGDHARSADMLVQLLSSPVDEEVRVEATAQVRRVVRTQLSESELQELARRYPESPIVDEVTLDLARKAYARGDYETAYRSLAEFLYRSPGNDQADEARSLLEAVSERRQAHAEAPGTIVHPNTIGVVLPVTGQLSLYGRYFQQGVDLALKEYNQKTKRPVKVVNADSRGNPVGAARAVRRLVLEEGATALLGSVFTMPTVAAAIEANAWGTPLLSPVVSTDDLADVGPWIYRTRIPPAVEVSAVVDVAVNRLGIERIAVVAPHRGERRELADLFASEATRLGAEIVAVEYYDEGATDFREQLDAVREAAPDAIFAPGTVEELLLLLPQVKFYDMQVQLLGLSDWNSEKLMRLSRNEIEGAIFPLEAYHGADRQSYERFRQAMTEGGATEISPVSEAGYFGMRLLLSAFEAGAASRGDVRDYLDGELRGDAESRFAEAQSLSLVIVRSGRVQEFEPPRPR